MNNFKEMMLKKIVAWLVGGELFDFIRSTVKSINDSDKTGAEKREYVQIQARKFTGKAVSVLINIAIETAVLLLKNKFK